MAIIGTVCVVLSCLLSLQVRTSNLIRVYGCVTLALQHLLSHLRNIASIEQINICR